MTRFYPKLLILGWKKVNTVEKITNLDYISEIAGGDEYFVKDLIETFVCQVSEFTHNMNEYLNKKQYGLLAKEAHTAKSSVMLFGLNHLADRLKEFQLVAEKQEQIETYPERIAEFERICQQAISELKTE